MIYPGDKVVVTWLGVVVDLTVTVTDPDHTRWLYGVGVMQGIRYLFRAQGHDGTTAEVIDRVDTIENLRRALCGVY